MKKFLKKGLALLLICALAAGSFGACSKKAEKAEDNKETGGTAVTKAADTEAADTKTAAGIDGWSPFKEKVTITIPVYDRSKEGYPPVDDNYWTKWVQTEFGDKWNIEVKYVAIPRNDVMTKYSMLIAAGDTPTILMEYDYPKVAQWANDGAMAELDLKAFAQVAPTYYQKMVDNDQLQYTNLNGKTYFALSERPYYNCGYTYAKFFRKDWLDAIGKGVPKNYKEYYEALDAIIAAGLTDQPPVGYSLQATAYVANYAYRDFPVNEEEWAMHSSLGTASLSWKATYELLKRTNSEYNKGYLSKEFELDVAAAGAGTASQAQTDFVNGKTFFYDGYMSSNVDWLNAFYENNPNAKLTVAKVYTGLEEYDGIDTTPAYRSDNPFGMIIGFSSVATPEQLKAAWMYMEWMSQKDTLFTLENGIEGVTFNYDANKLPVVVADYTGKEMLNHNCNIDMTCVVHASKVIGTIEDSIKAITPQGLPQDFYQELLDAYNTQLSVTKYAYTDPIFTKTIEAESEYSATLLSLYQEYSAKLIKCDPAKFDALYKELSQKYLDAGYQNIITERQEAYKNGFTTKLPQNLGK